MATPVITEKELRIFAMDNPKMNTLVDGVKFDSESIEQAQINVVDYFNIMPPTTDRTYTVETFPSRVLLVMGVWGYLLKGAAIGETQNQFEYAADGVQINDRNHGPMFLQMGQAYWQEFTELAKNVKVARNIERCYGSKGSEYRFRAYTI